MSLVWHKGIDIATRDGYLAIVYAVRGLQGIIDNFNQGAVVVGVQDDTRECPPFDSNPTVLGWAVQYPNNGGLVAGALMGAPSQQVWPLPGGGTLTVFYSC